MATSELKGKATKRAKPTAEARRFAALLRKWARQCEDTEDAEDGTAAVFVPSCVSGDFYDVLTWAADQIAPKRGRR